MRFNSFREAIAQPDDDRGAVLESMADKTGDGHPDQLFAEVYPDEDPNFGYGGELEDGSGTVSMSFDGFTSVEATQQWLTETLGLNLEDISFLT